MEGTLWLLIMIAKAGCVAAMHISYDTALRRRGQQQLSATAGCIGDNAGSLCKQLAMAVLLVMPFLLITALTPWATVRVILNFAFCWSAPCKLLLLFYANFFLDSPSTWILSKFSNFLLAFLLPVRLKGIRAAGYGGFKAELSHVTHHHLPTLMVEFSILLIHLSFYHILPPTLAHVSHCVALYLVLDLPHRISSIAFLILFSIHTHPTFRSPWLSSSLTDFWGQRWDLSANALLRYTVYNPVINLLSAPSLIDMKDAAAASTTEIILKLLRLSLAVNSACEEPKAASASLELELKKEGTIARKGLQEKMAPLQPFDPLPLPLSASESLSSKLLGAPTKPPSLRVRLTGVNATFFVSGLIHELVFFCVTQGQAPTGEVTAFFIVQGVATSMEIVWRRRRTRVVSASSNGDGVWHGTMANNILRAGKVTMTMGFMYATATCLFFPQLVRAGVYTKCAEEHLALKQAIKNMLF